MDDAQLTALGLIEASLFCTLFGAAPCHSPPRQTSFTTLVSLSSSFLFHVYRKNDAKEFLHFPGSG
jgi:hypothetical protein